jgi:hypothetical protein
MAVSSEFLYFIDFITCTGLLGLLKFTYWELHHTLRF